MITKFLNTLSLRNALLLTTANVSVLSGIWYFQYVHVQNKVKERDYFQACMKLLRKNEKALKILGTPIEEGRFDVLDENNICSNDTAKLRIPVFGPNKEGILFFWAQSEDKIWTLLRVDLLLDDETVAVPLIDKPLILSDPL